jgi:two-component system nitrogen regulation response regulator GlnG
MFREDLFYRLNVVRVHLPPLRQRIEDVRLLCEYFLAKISLQKHLPRVHLSEEALKVLEGYPWPGNVRELENTLQRACVLATTDVLLPKDIPLGAAGTGPAGIEIPGADGESANGHSPAAVLSSSERSSGQFDTQAAIELLFHAASQDNSLQLLPWLEREFTIAAMKLTRGNQLKAAKILGVTRATLRKRIERFGITRELNIQ